MARSLEELKALNAQRLAGAMQAKVDREEVEQPVEENDKLLPNHPASTGGVVINLANPIIDGIFKNPFVRMNERVNDEGKIVHSGIEKRGNGRELWIDTETNQRTEKPSVGTDWMKTRKVIPTSGDDATSVPIYSCHKYRIPPESVTRKQGDLKIFICCGFRPTAAQWIWLLNFICFFVHVGGIVTTLYYAYWKHGKDPMKDTKHLLLPIYRIRQIPTKYMLDANMSRWSDGWNATTTSEVTSGQFLYDNGAPINFATLIISFFATSAIFHFMALIMGAFERYWFWYWRQLDDCFAWWRWAEYSVSASIMALAMALTLGIREQNTLASIFMLTWATQTYGFLTEYISTPKAYADRKVHLYPVGPYQMEKFRDVNEKEYAKTDYYNDPSALKLISQESWDADRPMFDLDDDTAPIGLVKSMAFFVRSQRTRNYLRRMVPHIFGWFTMSSVWFILIAQLENAKRDLAEVSDLKMPEWVDGLIYGQFVIFTQFALVQIVFQRMQPGFYFGTEIIYCLLSLTAKVYLGAFLLINVIMIDGSADDALSRGPGDRQ